MRLFPHGRVYSFMKAAPYCAVASVVLVIATIAWLIGPGPKVGTDFAGGTEIEVAFQQPVTAEQIRQAARGTGLSTPNVIKVEDEQNPHRYMIRVQEVAIIPEEIKRDIEQRLCFGENLPADQCPEAKQSAEVKFSPGGDMITVRFRGSPDLQWVKDQLAGVSAIGLRPGANNPYVQSPRDNKVEIALLGTGDKLMNGLRTALGTDKVPETAMRAEWIGPKAGAQLRNSAIKAVLISLVFIMAYVAFRFDLRFAPGAVVCLIHDATLATGALLLTGREVNLTTIAALLTIVGYSVNDTVVIYDRVRENLGKLRGSSFPHLIDVSVSEMLGRTILTSGTTIFSLLAFFIWGTGTLKDFAFTLIVGIVVGTYSSVYVALPLTQWLDRVLFSKVSEQKKKKSASTKRAKPAEA